MPVFEIGLEDGRKLHIEADDQQAALAGVQHFMDQGQETQKPSTGVVAGLKQGVAGLVQGPAETLKQYGGVDTSGAEAQAAKIAPQNYQSAPVVDKDGVHLGALPQAVAEGAPGMAADIAAAKVASKIPVIGKYAAIPAGIASYLLRTRGQAAVERAANSQGEGATPTTGDKAAALATGAVEAIPQAIGIGRFLPGSGSTLANGVKGVVQAVGRGLGTAATTGAAGAATDVVSQVGATLGTPGGVQVDPLRAADAGVKGAVTGGLLASPRAAGEAATAIKYRAINSPELQAAAGRVSNRMVDAAEGANLANPKHGLDAMLKAESGIKNELSDAVQGVRTRTTLSPDAENALTTIQSGRKPGEAEYKALETALQGDPQANHLLDLARDQHVMTVLKGTGKQTKNAFVGGIATKLAGTFGVTPHSAAKGAVAALAVEHFGSHLIAQSPAVLAGGLGAYGLARGIDKLTGARSPANRFAKRFADPLQGIRTPLATIAAQPTAPMRPTGPLIPPLPTPWGKEPPAPPDYRPEMRSAAELMAARRANSKLARVADIADSKDIRAQVKDAADLMAARRSNETVARQNVGAQARDASDLMAARRANARIAQAQAQADVQQDQYGAADRAHEAFQRRQMQDASELMAARRANEKLAQTRAGTAQADALARTSPLIDEVGGLQVVSNPEFAARASKYLQAASAIKKLTAEPAEDAPTSAPSAPVIAKISKKLNGKVKETAAPTAEPTDTGYTPLTREQMPYYKKSHDYKANLEVASRKIDPDKAGKYREMVKRADMKRQGILGDLADVHEADAGHFSELYEQMKSLNRRSKAKQAVEHYASQMTPEGGAALRERFNTDLINSLWPK